MKFKVGDKVKVKNVSEFEVIRKTFNGRSAIVKGIVKGYGGQKENVYILNITDKYIFHTKELELVQPKQFAKNMKVIDLLVKISKGEEVPNKFKFASQTFTKRGNYIEDEDGDSLFDSMYTDFSNINSKIEIIEESQILDETEKKYLSDVIRPFRDNVGCIEKVASWLSEGDLYIKISLKNNEIITLPYFKDKRMYKGMELKKEYTIEELGLEEK